MSNFDNELDERYYDNQKVTKFLDIEILIGYFILINNV